LKYPETKNTIIIPMKGLSKQKYKIVGKKYWVEEKT